MHKQPYNLKNQSVKASLRRLIRTYSCCVPAVAGNIIDFISGAGRPSVYVEHLDEGYSEKEYSHPAEMAPSKGLPHIHSLPFELLFCIFEHLDALTLLKDSRFVCRYWDEVLCGGGMEGMNDHNVLVAQMRHNGSDECMMASCGSHESFRSTSSAENCEDFHTYPSQAQREFFWHSLAEQQLWGLFSHRKHVNYKTFIDYYTHRKWCFTNNGANSVHTLGPYNIALAQFETPPPDFISILERTLVHGNTFKFKWSGHSSNSRVMKIIVGIVFGDTLQGLRPQLKMNHERDTFGMSHLQTYFGAADLPNSLGVFLASGNVYFNGQPIFKPSREGHKWRPSQGDTISIKVELEDGMIHLRHNGQTYTKISFARLNLKRRDAAPVGGGCSLLLNNDMVSFPHLEGRESVFALMREHDTIAAR